MNTRDWEIIDQLYKLQNITKVANKLYIAQPTLTTRIKQIEQEFNTQLVVRHRRGIHFTPEGEYLAKSAEEVLQLYETINERLLSLKTDVAGTLKIGASNFFAKYKLPKLLRLFKEKYPNVECQVITGWSSEVYHLIKNRQVHVGFIRGDYSWNNQREVLFEENMCAVSTTDFSWEELPYLSRIDYGTDRKIYDLIEDWWNEQYERFPNITIEVDQVDTCKEMVLNGLGYGILPNLIIRDQKNLYVKPLIDKNNKIITRKTWIYYHQDTLQMNMIDAFIKHVHGIDLKEL